MDRPLNESTADKIRKYRADYNNHSSNTISFMLVIVNTSGLLHSELPLFCSFWISAGATYQWTLPLSPHGVLLTTQNQSGTHPCQDYIFTYQVKY
jgi:hypothetical protein